MEDSKESRLRAEFEAWARDRGYDLRPWKGVEILGPYAHIRTSDVYTGYRAASASRSEILEALKGMVTATERWNAAVTEILGRQPETGIDLQVARAALAKYQGE